jgi:phage protein U
MTKWSNDQVNWTELFQRKNSKWPKITQGNPQQPSQKGNANQNHIKISSHSYYNGWVQEHKQQKMLARMCYKRKPHTLLVGK